MDWTDAFDDLASELEAAARAEEESSLADRSRAERAVLDLDRRLRAHLGVQLSLQTCGGRRAAGVLRAAGAGWCLLDAGRGGAEVVRLAAVTVLRGLGTASAPEPSGLAERLGISIIVRRLSIVRAPLVVHLVDGSRTEGTAAVVGRDHVDLDVHPLDEPPRAAAVRERVTLPFAAVATLWCPPGWR